MFFPKIASFKYKFLKKDRQMQNNKIIYFLRRMNTCWPTDKIFEFIYGENKISSYKILFTLFFVDCF